ncbi:MAG: hypothetical protein KF866_04185 [Phycisphaeraceae bacterium]|nr:hypothetical protein [Phycisphaeraceae bacterium]
MDDWIVPATQEAMHRMDEHASLVGIANTDEFTFRSMFMAAAKANQGSLAFYAEWEKFDLLVMDGGKRRLIEFKYYLTRPRVGPDGRPVGWKGGAGPGNEREFWRCVEKLRSFRHSPVSDRAVILTYEREAPRRSRYSYHASYGGLCDDERCCRVIELSSELLVGRVIRVD